MLVTLLLAFAALMEVAGDALIRSGMRSGRIVGFVAGACPAAVKYFDWDDAKNPPVHRRLWQRSPDVAVASNRWR